jgi:hypothetical protein
MIRAAQARAARQRYREMAPVLNEQSRRRFVAVEAQALDENKYPKGVKVSDAQLAAVNLSPHSFHGEWNYTISPNAKKPTRQK